MWKVLCLLGVLAGPLKSHNLPVHDTRGMNGKRSQEVFDKVHYSFSVPIWQYTPGGEFVCKRPGYFPDPQNCQYFFKCTESNPSHLFRFVYRCEEGRVFSADSNTCIEGTNIDGSCIEKPEDKSMEVEGEEAEPDDITVEKSSSQDNLADEDEEESDGSTVNATTEKSLFSIHTPEVGRGLDIEDLINKGLRLLKVQPLDEQEVYEDITPIHDTPPSIPEQETTLPTTPEMESDEEDTTTVTISTTTLSTTSEAEEDRTTAAEVQTGKGQPITAISTTLHWPESKDTDDMRHVADQSVCYDKKNSSDCFDEGFFGVHEDCSKFYRCVSFGTHFVKYELQCPFGTIWDASVKSCNFRAAIKEKTCIDKSLPVTTTPPPTTTTTAPTTPPALPDDSDEDCPFDDIPEHRTGIICPTGFRQHPKYCNMFYQCLSSDNFEMNFTSLVCPDGMVFNMKLLRCEKNEIRSIGCTIFEPDDKQDDGRILIHSNLNLCPEEGRSIYGERCSSRYIECVRDENGNLEGYLLTCPHGQMYSRVRDQCRPNSNFHHCTL